MTARSVRSAISMRTTIRSMVPISAFRRQLVESSRFINNGRYGLYVSANGSGAANLVTVGANDLTRGAGNRVEGSGLYGIGAGPNVDIVGNSITGRPTNTPSRLHGPGRRQCGLRQCQRHQCQRAHCRQRGLWDECPEPRAASASMPARLRRARQHGLRPDDRHPRCERLGRRRPEQRCLRQFQLGIEVGNSTNTDIINNTVYYQLVGNAIFLNGTTSGTVLTNNIIVALNALGVVVANSAQAGFASGFKHLPGRPRRSGWAMAGLQPAVAGLVETGQPAGRHKLRRRSALVDPDGADNVLGYVSPASMAATTISM